MEKRSPSHDQSDYLEMLLRHKYKIVLLPTLTLALGLAVILFAPRVYHSEAKVLLRIGRESVGIDPTATTGQTLNLQQNGRDSEVQSAIDLLLSRGMAEKVVAAIGDDYVLRGGPPGSGKKSPVYESIMRPVAYLIKTVKNIDPISDKERAVIEFTRHLNVDAERYSTVIYLSYETDSPIGAQAILDKMITIFQDEYMRLYRNPASHSFFSDQRELLEKQLDDASSQVRDAKNRMGLASVGGRRASLEGQVSSIELSMYDAEQKYATAAAQINDLKDQLTHLPERQIASKTSVPNAGADLLREQLYELQVKQIDLAARYNEDHPLVKSVSAQVEEARKIVDEQETTRSETVDDINPIHRTLLTELKRQQSTAAGLTARLQTLEEQKRLLMSDLKQLNANEVELMQLEREVQLAQNKFFTYSDSYEQARIDKALESQSISSVSVPQPASLQEKPVSPSKLLVGLAAMALSFGGVVSWVAASESLNSSIRSESDAERSLGLPVYASIPNKPEHSRVIAR